MPSCIRAPPAAVKMMYGQFSWIAVSTPRMNASPTASPIDPPMKAKSWTPITALRPSIVPRAVISASPSDVATRAALMRST